MISRQLAASKLPVPSYQRIVATNFGNNDDIQATLERYLPEAIKQTKQLAKSFKADSDYQTGLNVWRFLKHQIQYRIDPLSSQDIRLPNYLVASGIGDCKSFALFSAAILINLGYKVALVYAGYRANSNVPTHVYTDYARTLSDLKNPQRQQLYSLKNLTAMQRGKKRFWILDAVYLDFDTEKAPKSIIKKIIV